MIKTIIQYLSLERDTETQLDPVHSQVLYYWVALGI
jgi:hypothetical protein